MKKLLLIELNELNFDLIKRYVEKYPKLFPYLSSLFSLNQSNTSSEIEYQNLEPWIQWVSAHTGKDFKDHKIFRLGDIVNSDHEQIFEVIEKKGYRVGVVSGMNVKNSLEKSEYFIPDPWTNTSSDGTFFSKLIHSVIKQTVNDNSNKKITLKSIFFLVVIFLRFVKIKDYLIFIKHAFMSIGKSWRKALFLDLLLHKVHLKLLEEKKADFSTIFLTQVHIYNTIICSIVNFHLDQILIGT